MLFEKTTEFYMANFEPEMARFAQAVEENKKDEALIFKNKTINILGQILASTNLSPAGREEWQVIRNLVESYDSIDDFSKKVLLAYGQPFSYAFMKKLSLI